MIHRQTLERKKNLYLMEYVKPINVYGIVPYTVNRLKTEKVQKRNDPQVIPLADEAQQ